MTEHEWQVNITQKSRRVNLRNLFNIDSNSIKAFNTGLQFRMVVIFSRSFMGEIICSKKD